MIYSERVKSHQSAPGGTVSPVKTMIIGGHKHIESRIPESFRV